MNTDKCERINWDVLVDRIESREVIPVIGQGLYLIQVGQNPQDILLYDYLAQELSKETGVPLNPQISHKFSQAALDFLRKNNFGIANNKLRRFLSDILKDIRLSPHSPLWKLARIKPFQFFINTTYDDFLFNTLRSTRNYPTDRLYYTLTNKKMDKLTDILFDNLQHSKSSLVYNIYGNLMECTDSAFTEKDILENIFSFHESLIVDKNNPLGLKLKASRLLFIGCGYDDWLFRFFIRTVANQPYQYSSQGFTPWKYVSDQFENKQKDPFAELPRFLTTYDTDVCYVHSGKEFTDTLFEKLEQKFPKTLIPVSEFPETAFISFHGANRAVAFKLADQLLASGINVWVDKREFKPGDQVDSTIIKAMGKCPVFIPLISTESQQLFLENGVQKYHCQEWNWIYYNENKNEHPSKIIIPVVIDDTQWMYERFKDLNYIRIPGGSGGDYEILKARLLEIQQSDLDRGIIT